LLVIGTSAFGQEIRLFPLRSAPLGSPVGTLGAPVVPTFVGGAWNVAFPAGGIEVDIDVQGGGWGNAAGAPTLGAIQATMDSSGYSNGVGCDIVPKGFPANPQPDGAYQAFKVCGAGGDGRPASPPFDTLCTGNGFPVDNPDYIFRPFMNSGYVAAIATPVGVLDYAYATAAQDTSNTQDPDPSSFGTFGGLIMEVPACAAGTYIVGPNPDPNVTFMTDGGGAPINGVTSTPASITITTGKCCSNIGPNVACEDNLTTGQCDQRPGPRLFVPNDTCSGVIADDCPICTFGVNSTCEEDPPDLCTDQVCNQDGTCSYSLNYDPQVNCCDSATGGLTPIDDDDVCTDDVCNADGSVSHPFNTDPCDDGFACTSGDVCADGVCAGTDVNTIPCPNGDSDCPLGECGAAGLCECSEDTPLTCTLSAGTALDPNCFDDGELLTAQIGIGAGSEIVFGGQFLLNYASDCLDFVSLGPCAGTTFTDIIEYQVDETAGTIWYAATTDVAAPVGTPGPEAILCIDFAFSGDCAGCDPSICFDSVNPRNTILTNNTGNAVPTIENCCKGIHERGVIDLHTPPGADINADCGLPSAEVNWDCPAATDSCDGDLEISCIAAHDGGLNIQGLLDNCGGEFPQGTSFFRCEATNSCGDTAVNVWTVDVSDQHGLNVEVHLSPTIVGDNFERAIEFALYLDCVSDPTEVCEVLTFGGPYNFNGHARATLKVDKGNYQCITARDCLHTLRGAADVECIDNEWSAVFKGDPLQGGNWLVGGNLDCWKAGGNANTIDILDAGIYLSVIAGVSGSTAPGANTDCNTMGPHADINADGVVDSADWSFILENFLSASKDACCPRDTGSAPADIPLTSVTRKMMIDRDMGAFFMDLDNDGDMDTDDIAAYMNGVEPVSPFGADRKVRGAQR
jgi:hypothetical protein